LHTLLTKEKLGYYADFGGVAPLITTLRDGWCYSGQYSQSRKCRHGNSPRGIAPPQFVVYNQNHDQVGNRAAGERLNDLVGFEAVKVAAGITLLSPFTPMLFMGEEYGEPAPFQYFTSHADPIVVEAVRNGRREEFAAFGWEQDVPDPQDDRTYARSKLNHSLKEQEPHKTLLRFYRRLIEIRKEHELALPATQSVRAEGSELLMLLRKNPNEELAMFFNFSDQPACFTPKLAGSWTIIINSADAQWRGPESYHEASFTFTVSSELKSHPHSFLVIARTRSGESV
jgi:maltooligosyltrehalose trehalohydrolase